MREGFIVVILLALLFLIVIGNVIRRRAASGRPGDVARELRLQALRSKSSVLVMDIGYADAVASVVAASTGDASIYLSTGGGITGGIQHENVRAAAIAFLQQSAAHLGDFQRTDDYPYPAVGAVRFYAVTPEGVSFAEADERELREGRHSLSALYAAGHEVITALRESAEAPVQT